MPQFYIILYQLENTAFHSKTYSANMIPPYSYHILKIILLFLLIYHYLSSMALEASSVSGHLNICCNSTLPSQLINVNSIITFFIFL